MKEKSTKLFKRLSEIAIDTPVLGLLVRAGIRSAKGHEKDMAASIAFFGFLSLFPMALGMIALAGTVLKSEKLRLQVMNWVNEFFPVGSDFVTQNIESVVRLGGTVGLVSVLVLFWSAKKMVGALSRGINGSLGLKRGHAIYLSPLRNFSLTVFISLLMFGATAFSPLADLISNLELLFLGERWRDLIDLVGGHIVSLGSTGVMIACSYFLLPYHRPGWRAVWPGLLTATLLIEAGKKLFVYYVDNVASMDALYGSFSSIIVLMLWLYFFGRVLLFGTDVNYVHSNPPRGKPKTDEKPV